MPTVIDAGHPAFACGAISWRPTCLRFGCMATALYDFLSMIPNTHSLHGSDPYAAYMKGKEVCTTDGEELVRWVEAHKVQENVERTCEVYWIRKGRRATGEHSSNACEPQFTRQLPPGAPAGGR